MSQDPGRPNQNSPSEPAAPVKYAWPRYVLGAVILFVLLAVWWMSRLIREIQYRKQLMQGQTNLTLQVKPVQSLPVRTNVNLGDLRNDNQP